MGYKEEIMLLTSLIILTSLLIGGFIGYFAGYTQGFARGAQSKEK